MINPRCKALTFDCYGTLIDWESGILSVLRPWSARHGVERSDHDLLFAFANAESQCERDTPTALYTNILRHVHERLSDSFGISQSDVDAEEFAQSVGDWPPFPDTCDALAELKKRYTLAIISNVDRVSFRRTNKSLGIDFDIVVTAEDVGVYKPDHRAFLRAFALLHDMGIEKDEIVHVAQSLYHDHVPARALGLSSIWVDRRRDKGGSGATPMPRDSVTPEIVVANIAELVALLTRTS